MKHFIDKLKNKMDIAKSDSDFAYYFSLLVTGEAITKLVTLMTASALITDKDRHQYRILHGLVRANGIGDWSKSIDDLLTGTASQYLASEYRIFQTELTRKAGEDEWQSHAVQAMIDALNTLDIRTESFNGKKDLKSWFRLFTELRNKTRGHGALLPSKAAFTTPYLEKSLLLIIDNLSLLNIPTAFLKRNLSGKYRVTDIGNSGNVFDIYKSNNTSTIEDGIYIQLGSLRKVPLILSDSDLTDFYISNGSFNNSKYELLSYLTDDKKYGDSSDYLAPLGTLPPSESEGLGELECKGKVFTNAPELSYEYISRNELEDQLYSLLIDDRRTVVTLLGRGGIGKTSLALKVIPRLYETERFSAIIWFSSRDIDLQTSGAKLVTADVISAKDISKYFCSLVLSVDSLKSRTFDQVAYFQEQLTNSNIGPCLFVFDNFETTENPVEVFKWIDTYIRNPNKVLVTTRLREFLGDYPVNVHGMTEKETEELIRLTATHLNVEKDITEKLINEIYNVSAGHPYIIKIMLGELSKTNMKGSLPKIIAGSDEVLTALFERTYSALNPCAQRVFLTLSSWNSAVPRLALEAVLMKSIDEPLEVERAIDTLLQYSLAEEFKSETDNQYFISLPLTARSFGAKKLRVSPLKSAISSDVKILQNFGTTKMENRSISLSHYISTFLSHLDNPKQDYVTNKELIDRIGYSYPDSRLTVARWLVESGDHGLLQEARNYLYLYLENESIDANKISAWSKLADISRKLKQPLDEIHALIESSQYSQVEFSDLSNVVNKVNHMLNTQELVLESHDVKTELLSKIYDVVWRRKVEGDATDYSRLAWLALHLDKIDDAKYLTEQGLKIDEDNRYCLKLQSRFDAKQFSGLI